MAVKLAVMSPVCPKLSEVQLKKIVRSKQEYKKRNINLMDYDNGFILQKTMDWSLLNDGMTIPVSVCSLFTSHHIDYFTHSQNNYSTNIISSVRITTAFQKNNPRFNRKKFQFEFENGEVLRLKLNEHLKVG